MSMIFSKLIPGLKENDRSAKYSNEPILPDYFLPERFEHSFESTTASAQNDNNSVSEIETENTTSYKNPNDSEYLNEFSRSELTTASFDQFLESTTRPPLFPFERETPEFFTDTPRISTNVNLQQQQNQSSDITRSAFYHDFLLNPAQNTNAEQTTTTTSNPSSNEQNIQTTTDYSLENKEQNVTQNQNIEITTETTANEKFLEHFWNNFNEQSVLFSEAQLHNQTSLQNDSKPLNEETIEWISEQIDKKSIMFSEGRVDNKTEDFSIEAIPTTTTSKPIPTTTEPLVSTSKIIEAITQTTPVTTETLTEVTTTTMTTTTTPSTTTPEITTTEVTVNKEFLDSFWHNFNDNSDEYFEITVDQNKTTNQSEQSTPYPPPNETTTRTPLNITSEKNITEMENTLSLTEDLDQMEGRNYSLNMTSPTFGGRFLPSVQPSEQNQYIPPLSALFEFPHMRKRVRRVKRPRNLQNSTPEEQLTTTSTPEEVDIMANDATEEVSDISASDEDSSHLKSAQHLKGSTDMYRHILCSKRVTPKRTQNRKTIS